MQTHLSISHGFKMGDRVVIPTGAWDLDAAKGRLRTILALGHLQSWALAVGLSTQITSSPQSHNAGSLHLPLATLLFKMAWSTTTARNVLRSKGRSEKRHCKQLRLEGVSNNMVSGVSTFCRTERVKNKLRWLLHPTLDHLCTSRYALLCVCACLHTCVCVYIRVRVCMCTYVFSVCVCGWATGWVGGKRRACGRAGGRAGGWVGCW